MKPLLGRAVDVACRVVSAWIAIALAAGVAGCAFGAYHALMHGRFWLASVRPKHPGLNERIGGTLLNAAFAFALYVATRRFWRAAWTLEDPTQDDPFATPRCRACGYDLRATPRRCPECGAETCFDELVEEGDKNAEGPNNQGTPRSVATAAAPPTVVQPHRE